MKLKKHLKCAAILSTLCVGLLFPMAAQADTEYETKEVTTYLFDNDHSTEMTLLFTNDLPTIPYIRVTDYLNTVYKANDFEAKKQEDGAYQISSGTSEYIMTVDPNYDLVGFNEYTNFIMQEMDAADDMDPSSFVQNLESGYEGGAKPVLLDPGAYGIDILEIDGEVYLPLATMNDLFKEIYNAAQYLDGKLYFLHSSDLIMSSCYFDRSSLYDQLERSAAEAQFNYNELCFMMDYSYGAPTSSKLAGKILEVGFDKALDSSDKLKKAKTYLKSESIVDYLIGLYYISEDLFDGLHTIPIQDIQNAFQTNPDSKIVQELQKVINTPERAEDKAICGAYEEHGGARGKVLTEISQEKVKTVGSQYTLVKEWEDCGAGLYIAGDTAFFTFDDYVIPVVEAFKWSVDKAAELGMKNFVVDLTTNNGGVTSVIDYMLTLMTNKQRKTNTFTEYNYYRASQEMLYQTSLVDLNLDGKFDDADKEVAYDLHFAILESKCSFSSANWMPVIAKEMGIAILGENSGGGGCTLLVEFMASGYFMNMSGMPKFCTANPNTDVDLGAKPDYELAYDEMFDAELLSSKIHEFYDGYRNEWVNGLWYDKDGNQTYTGIGAWKKNSKGWWYEDSKGWYPKNCWQKIDGCWYYFDKAGYMEQKAYHDGYYLGANGAWDGKQAAAGWKKGIKGWWYSLGGQKYLSDTWMKIDGKWYYFEETGYASQSEFVDGWWVDKDCVQSDSTHYTWHKDSKGWWFGKANGWYAKNATFKINHKDYSFDADGYCTNP